MNMKQVLFSFILMLVPIVASADAVEINGIYYNLVTKAKVAEVTKNPNQYSGKVVIPETVQYGDVTYRVTSIGEYAFQSNTGLTSLTMANSITTIGTYAFAGCSSLSNLVLSEGLTEIASYTFWYCESLVSVVIPKSVIKIGWAAFCDCTKLQNVDMYEGLEEIGDSAFYHSSVVEANIPKSVTTIGRMAFSLCEDLTSVSIPNSVTTIGSSAFNRCRSLTSVDIPESVTSIDGLFSDCTNLASVTIPNSVTQIGSSTFSNCSSLTSVTIPSNVMTIGGQAFEGCTGLTSVIIPNTVTNIGDYAFSGCSGLTTATIGRSVTSIGNCAFAKCSNLTDVYCYAKTVPAIVFDPFLDSYIEFTTLHVPAACLDEYKTTEPWSEFKEIVPIDGDTPDKKCAKPTISVEDGKLKFSSETEDVKYHYTITYPNSTSGEGNDVSFSQKIIITVYAYKSGYENSETATAEITATGGKQGDLNNDGVINAADVVKLVNIIMGE